MSGDENVLKSHAAEPGRKLGGQRILAGIVATAALGASLWAATGGLGCMECRLASAVLWGIPLAWAGVVFYGVLAATAGWSGFSPWTRAGFFAAAGVHLVLLSLMARERIFCSACVAAGSAAFMGAFCATLIRPRSILWGIPVFAAAVLATVEGTAIVTPTHLQLAAAQTQATPAQTLLGNPDAASIKPGQVILVVYERDGCKHCLDFEENVLPRLQTEFGASLDVERRDADIDMETPTIDLEGKAEGPEFTGVPEYQDIEKAILKMQSRP